MDNNADAAVWMVWQQQDEEEPPMSIDQVRAKADILEKRRRRWATFTAILFVVIVIVEALQVWIQESLLERAGDSLTIAAVVYVAYRFRRQRAEAPPVTLGTTGCATFYRAELARQRDLSRDSRGYLLPFVPGVALALFGRGLGARPLSQTVAIIAFGIALFVGAAWWNTHTARRLQDEIDALDMP